MVQSRDEPQARREAKESEASDRRAYPSEEAAEVNVVRAKEMKWNN